MLIHIGFHKTGTSYLQRYLFENPANNFVAPWNVRTGEAIEHFVLSHPMRFDPSAVREAFLSKIADCDKALVPVISHEDLVGCAMLAQYYGHDVADRLYKTFPNAKILITIREQKSLLRSLYGQYVRQDGEWPIEMFLGKGDEPPGFAPICRLDHFEYDLLVSHYVRLFGDGQVLVLPFEILKSSPIKFQQCIHDFAGTGITANAEYERELAGLGALSLRLMRRLNKVVRQPPDWHGNWHKNPALLRAKIKLCTTIDALMPRAWHRPEERRLVAFVNRRVGGYFEESNKRLQCFTKFELKPLGYNM